MAKCKFCGEPVKVSPVFHLSCWVQAVNKYAGEICDEYCMLREGLFDLQKEAPDFIKTKSEEFLSRMMEGK